MGQYYKPINLDSMEWLYSHEYDRNGLKLMEHSWIGNPFVGAVMTLLSPGNKWHKKPLVWCGDYYDEEGEENYYALVEDRNKLSDIESMTEEKQLNSIIVNHTKKMYVVCKELRKNGYGWRINPLPLLTALGNDRGGGDYCNNNTDFDKVGIWARDIISVESSIPKRYKKLEIDFYEQA